MQRAQRHAELAQPVHLGRPGQRAFGIDMRPGTDLAIRRGDPVQAGPDQIDRAQATLADRLRGLDGRHFGGVRPHGMYSPNR